MYPQNGVQSNYVPQVPHVGYRWGTKTSTPQDGKYLIFLKNLSTLLFLVGLIYRWGKGLKTKNDEKQVKIDEKHQQHF